MSATVEAAWIAASAAGLGIIGTVMVAISGARNTRKATEQSIDAERRLHLLDGRADAYQDIVADLLARQAERDRKFYPIRIDAAGSVYQPAYPPYEVTDYYNKFGRLLTYCTSEIRKLLDESTSADGKVAILYREYLSLADVAKSIENDPADELARTTLGGALADWRAKVGPTLTDAADKDDELVDQIRAELDPDPPIRPARAWMDTLGGPDPGR
jgi:hypothetical protein